MSNTLLKLRILHVVNYGYGRMMDTSGRGVEQMNWPVSKPVSNIVKIIKDLTMVVVENQACELF
jgi:hypothetical protein